MEFLSFSFMQGVMAFLAPCAVALLPGYVTAYVSREVGPDAALQAKLIRGLKLALFSILGILLIYALAGGLIVVASHILKMYMKYITVGMGGLLIVLGILILAGKNISLSINFNEPTTTRESSEAFFFGVAYAIGALGCLFPLFLVVATQAMAAENTWVGASYIGAYFLGIGLMMVGTIMLATFAQKVVNKYLRRVLPYMDRITAIVLISAGVYVIHYQWVLF